MSRWSSGKTAGGWRSAHGDTSLAAFRAGGTSAAALVGWLAQQSGLRAEDAPATPAELLDGFDLAKLPRTPVTWRGYPLPADGR